MKSKEFGCPEGWGRVSLDPRMPLTTNALSALCHASTTCGFVVSGNSVAMWFLLPLEILHFDRLVNWLGPIALEGALVDIHPRVVYINTHTQDRLDSASRSITKNQTRPEFAKNTCFFSEIDQLLCIILKYGY